MSFESINIAESIHINIDKLVKMTSGEDAASASADQMERQMFKGLLALGRELMQLFFTTRSEQETIQAAWEAGDTGYPYAGQKTRSYLSIFGEVEVERCRGSDCCCFG